MGDLGLRVLYWANQTFLGAVLEYKTITHKSPVFSSPSQLSELPLSLIALLTFFDSELNGHFLQ